MSLCMDNAREGGSLEAAADGPVSFFLSPSWARSLPRCGLLLCLGGLWVEDTALDELDFFSRPSLFFGAPGAELGRGGATGRAMERGLAA